MVRKKPNWTQKGKVGLKGERPMDDNFTVFLAGAVSKCKENNHHTVGRLKDSRWNSEESLAP